MLLLGLALASTLSLSPPGDASAEAPIIVVTPAPAPAPPPPPVPDWSAAASVTVSVPAPAPPLAPPPAARTPRTPMKGVGLFIASGVAFGAGLSARLNQVDMAARSCGSWKRLAHDYGAPIDSVTSCFDYFDSPGLDANDGMVGFAYGTSMVLNMIASGANAQHKAWQTVHGDGRVRNPNSRYVAGAIFSGLGVAAIATHFALIYSNSRNPCTSWECNVQRRAMWIAASDGGALLLNTGLGLSSWAGGYRSNVAKYQRRQWAVVPGAAGGGFGATMSLRF